MHCGILGHSLAALWKVRAIARRASRHYVPASTARLRILALDMSEVRLQRAGVSIQAHVYATQRSAASSSFHQL